jgi:nucleoside-diphosphate-sugar epimerase
MTRTLVAASAASAATSSRSCARVARTTALLRDPARSHLVEADEMVFADLLEPDAERLDAALTEIDLVFSAAGQSRTVQSSVERRWFRDVDTVINRALLEAALRNGVTRSPTSRSLPAAPCASSTTWQPTRASPASLSPPRSSTP